MRSPAEPGGGAAVGTPRRDVDAAQHDAPTVEREDARDQVEDRRLAGAVRPD